MVVWFLVVGFEKVVVVVVWFSSDVVSMLLIFVSEMYL